MNYTVKIFSDPTINYDSKSPEHHTKILCEKFLKDYLPFGQNQSNFISENIHSLLPNICYYHLGKVDKFSNEKIDILTSLLNNSILLYCYLVTFLFNLDQKNKFILKKSIVLKKIIETINSYEKHGMTKVYLTDIILQINKIDIEVLKIQFKS